MDSWESNSGPYACVVSGFTTEPSHAPLKKKIDLFIFTYVCLCVPACVYVYHDCAEEEGTRSLRTGVRGGCEPTDVGAENST